MNKERLRKVFKCWTTNISDALTDEGVCVDCTYAYLFCSVLNGHVQGNTGHTVVRWKGLLFLIVVVRLGHPEIRLIWLFAREDRSKRVFIFHPTPSNIFDWGVDNGPQSYMCALYRLHDTIHHIANLVFYLIQFLFDSFLYMSNMNLATNWLWNWLIFSCPDEFWRLSEW